MIAYSTSGAPQEIRAFEFESQTKPAAFALTHSPASLFPAGSEIYGQGEKAGSFYRSNSARSGSIASFPTGAGRSARSIWPEKCSASRQMLHTISSRKR